VSPTVELYWCGNAINAAPVGRTRHRPLLSCTVHCPVCGIDTSTAGFPHRPGEGCAHRPSFLEQIPAAEVLDEVLDLLSQNTWRRPASRHDDEAVELRPAREAADDQRSSCEMASFEA
jgi:hypothetical protein